MEQPVDLVELASRNTTGEPGERFSRVDPVAAEIIRAAMETTCAEVATHVSLTATTPILNQSNERNASVMDWSGRLAALNAGVPQFMLSSTLPVRFALDFFGSEGLTDGDMILSNDPYHGGGHLPDYNVFAPVFDRGGELVLIVSIQCHHGDTGGAAPGGYPMDALDIWAEGVRFPAMKIIEGGRERDDVLYMLQANNRLATFMGDVRSQIGACHLGVRQLKELIDTYGTLTVKQSVDYMIWHSGERFKEEVRQWPAGKFSADVYADRDPQGNEDIHVHCAVTVHEDGRLNVDFAGSDTRENLGSYSSFGNTRGYVVSQLAAMLDPDIPKNEGFFNSVEINAPEGTCVNPRYGKSVAAGTHHPGSEVGEAIAVALSQAIPQRACPQVYKLASPTVIYGEHPRTGAFFVDQGTDTYAGYCSAIKGQDGWGARNCNSGNLMRSQAEFQESTYPVRFITRDMIADTGGPGQWRGHPGSLYVKQLLTDVLVNAWIMGVKHPVPGIAGGWPGSENYLVMRGGSDNAWKVTSTAFKTPHADNEAIIYQFGGGGGWGDPLDRDPEAVREDVLDGYVSLEGATRDYGVTLSGDIEDETLVVDLARTEELRCKVRSNPAKRQRLWNQRLDALRSSAEENARRAGEWLRAHNVALSKKGS